MRIKYNRVSTLQQTGARFANDTDVYDLTFFDKVSGTVSFLDRPKGKELKLLVESGKVTELVVEEFSRLGRNTGDVIKTLEWLDCQNVNVVVKNLGLQSLPGGKKNPVWKMISSIMSSLYEMELENIKERTTVGRLVYQHNGGKLGRPEGTKESDKKFLEKPINKEIIKYLNRGMTIREVSKQTETSTKTVVKVKNLIKN